MKTSNVVIGLLATGAALLLGRHLYKKYRKEKETIAKKKEEKEAEIVELGLNPEKFEEEISKDFDAQNLPKQLFHGIRFSNNWDLEVLYGTKEHPINECENPIYVMQSEYNGNRSLDLYFSIPTIEENFVEEKSSDKRNKKKKKLNLNPQIPDFVNAINDKMREVCDDLKFVDDPHTKWKGFAIITYQSKDENGKIYNEQSVIELRKDFYEGWSGETNDRALVAFVNDWKLGKPETDEKINTSLKDWLSDRELIFAEVKDVILCYKVSFEMADLTVTGKPTNLGINLPLGLIALKKITNELMVYFGYHDNENEKYKSEKMKNSKIILYNRLIFCAPDENDRWNLALNYYTNNGHIVIDLMSYE